MSMKTFFIWISLFTLSIGFAQNETLFSQATEYYNNGEYNKAIDNYKAILESGQHSASLYFNLGNCYYKLNSIGPSIYYYEKALLLDPHDNEILNNLAYAQNMRLDAIEAMPKTEISKIYNSAINLFGINQWAYLAVAFVSLFVILYLTYFFLSSANKKRFSFIASIFSIALGVLCILMAYLQQQQQKKDDPAIVFSKEVKVSSEPNQNSDVIFTLHEGTKVNVLEELDGWQKIWIADGQTGWLLSNNIKKIKDF